MSRIVVDTNVLVSSLLGEGSAKSLLHTWIDGNFELISSDELLDELLFTIAKPRLARRIPDFETKVLIALIKKEARILIEFFLSNSKPFDSINDAIERF